MRRMPKRDVKVKLTVLRFVFSLSHTFFLVSELKVVHFFKTTMLLKGKIRNESPSLFQLRSAASLFSRSTKVRH